MKFHYWILSVEYFYKSHNHVAVELCLETHTLDCGLHIILYFHRCIIVIELFVVENIFTSSL